LCKINLFEISSTSKRFKLLPLKKALVIISSFLLLLACDSAEDKKGRFLLKGNVRLQENDISGARGFYEEALKVDPNFAEEYYNRGLTYKMAADYQQAIMDFSQAISLKNDYADAYYQRSLSHLDHGENYKALEDAKFLIGLENQSSRGYFVLGLGNEALRRYEEARAAFTDALQWDPNNVDLYVNRATIQYYLGNVEEALADLEKGKALNPKEANIYNLHSMIAFDQGDYDGAYGLVQQALEHNSSQPYFYNNRGLYQLYLGNLEEGLEDINLSLHQKIRNLYALRNKGIYYAMMGEQELALKYLEEVHELDPNMPLVTAYLEKVAVGN